MHWCYFLFDLLNCVKLYQWIYNVCNGDVNRLLVHFENMGLRKYQLVYIYTESKIVKDGAKEQSQT